MGDSYYSSTEAFIKKTDAESNPVYESLKLGKQYKEYTKNTNQYLTAGKLLCLTNLIPKDKHEQPMSKHMINLYLLKYKIESLLKTEKMTIQDQKVKK